MEEACDLCIVGAGYTGLAALDAASKYLAPGSRVVVVDRGYRWGGHWGDQYAYCALHLPYNTYSARERSWSIRKSKDPLAHLATRCEILAHFKDIVEA